MGYLIAAVLMVVAVGLLLMMAFKSVSKRDPERDSELDPEAAGTSYEKPQDEGPV